jgi:two-component system chemotaxis response regulator CheB
MPGRDIVVIGASAGGVETLRSLVAGLPADLPAAVFVVVHFPIDQLSILPRILGRSGPLPAAHARSGEPIQASRIYVAPPNHHMTLEDGHVEVDWGPRINHCRPAIDPLFRSAARSYGNRVIGLLLSGLLNDGTAGLMAVERAGGLAIVQDPDDALFRQMPESAIHRLENPLVLPLSETGKVLTNLVGSQPERGSTMKDPLDDAKRRAEADIAAQERGERVGKVSVLTCPDCGGVLWQVNADEFVEFRCHTGHIYTSQAVALGQSELLEKSLSQTLRALREKQILARQLASHARARGQVQEAETYERRAKSAERHRAMIEGILREQADLPPQE